MSMIVVSKTAAEKKLECLRCGHAKTREAESMTVASRLVTMAYCADRQGTIAEGGAACSGGLKIAKYPTPPLST